MKLKKAAELLAMEQLFQGPSKKREKLINYLVENLRKSEVMGPHNLTQLKGICKQIFLDFFPRKPIFG